MSTCRAAILHFSLHCSVWRHLSFLHQIPGLRAENGLVVRIKFYFELKHSSVFNIRESATAWEHGVTRGRCYIYRVQFGRSKARKEVLKSSIYRKNASLDQSQPAVLEANGCSWIIHIYFHIATITRFIPGYCTNRDSRPISSSILLT